MKKARKGEVFKYSLVCILVCVLTTNIRAGRIDPEQNYSSQQVGRNPRADNKISARQGRLRLRR